MSKQRSFHQHEPDPSFTWRHFEAEIMLLCIRWYLRYPLSYRDLEELLLERGITVDHTTIYRWVQRYAPELERRCRPHLKSTNDSWRVDETYVKVKGVWMYLYRAVDSEGNTLEFLLSPTRDAEAAKQLFPKTLEAAHTGTPRVITVDKKAAFPKALANLKSAGAGPPSCELREAQVSQQHHRTRPSVYQATGQTGVGLLVVWHGLAHAARVRSHAHDEEGADEGG